MNFLLTADLTVKTAPACDVTGLVVGQRGAVVWQAGRLNLVIEISTLLQF